MANNCLIIKFYLILKPILHLPKDSDVFAPAAKPYSLSSVASLISYFYKNLSYPGKKVFSTKIIINLK